MKFTGLFDSHAHYNNKQFDKDRKSLLTNLHIEGVDWVCNVGWNRESSRSAVALAREYDFAYAAVGTHPHGASSLTQDDLDQYALWAKEKKVVAIGEIGLDYNRDFSPRDKQREAFEKQLTLAKDLNLPVIIHTRDAIEETLEILKKFKPRGVVHCFSESMEVSREVTKLGMYVGMTGIITYTNARKSIEVVRDIRDDRLLLETDCPYLAPVPFRSKRADSTMLHIIAEKVAEVKGMHPQDLVDTCTENTFRVFEITK